MALCRLLLPAFLISQANAFIRRGINCEEPAVVDFGFDTFTTCQFVANNCSSLRSIILDSIENVVKDIGTLDDGTGKDVPLIKPALDTKADSNETDWQCNIPVGVQIKILYNPVRAIRDKFSIVGASLSVEESTAPVDYNARLAWSVLFREVRPKSKTSRWWEEMTSRDGSSYSIFWIFAGIIPEGSPPGPYVFSLGSVALSCFIILRPYY
ncbi:uncharacterized protein [Halyomorpha halys]|uniref:uncharacterized protein isoform X1 n=1 Tax=Halyomorpha halys TaxID=286706 RepID=UPI0006D5039E|nr:uncharacterized protein LOC106688124 [Halyomorpha halys]